MGQWQRSQTKRRTVFSASGFTRRLFETSQQQSLSTGQENDWWSALAEGKTRRKWRGKWSRWEAETQFCFKDWIVLRPGCSWFPFAVPGESGSAASWQCRGTHGKTWPRLRGVIKPPLIKFSHDFLWLIRFNQTRMYPMLGSEIIFKPFFYCMDLDLPSSASTTDAQLCRMWKKNHFLVQPRSKSPGIYVYSCF